ncbi:MAG: DUF3098 domain-containing protein [Bacteroidetes bacterium]|nr:MAG: DUF3098 domain-containing protein [Bacteroidota bacterium]
MSTKSTKEAGNAEGKSQDGLLFGRENYLIMLAGVVIIAIGFMLMSGKEDIFSSTKITVAPILVLLGFVVEVFAIFYKKK